MIIVTITLLLTIVFLYYMGTSIAEDWQKVNVFSKNRLIIFSILGAFSMYWNAFVCIKGVTPFVKNVLLEYSCCDHFNNKKYDDLDIMLVGNELVIGNKRVDLSHLVDEYEPQVLSLHGDILTITGGNSISLSDLE